MLVAFFHLVFSIRRTSLAGSWAKAKSALRVKL
jgi:hypothetical protein